MVFSFGLAKDRKKRRHLSGKSGALLLRFPFIGRGNRSISTIFLHGSSFSFRSIGFLSPARGLARCRSVRRIHEKNVTEPMQYGQAIQAILRAFFAEIDFES